jgi:hypothetical protein
MKKFGTAGVPAKIQTSHFPNVFEMHDRACGFCDILVDLRCVSGATDVQSP